MGKSLDKGRFLVSLPKNEKRALAQNQEYCFVCDKQIGKTFKIGFHEYGRIYSIPGLYEYLFHEKLQCTSPHRVCTDLLIQITQAGLNPADLCVLELGAGNGLVGEQLQKTGIKEIYAVDILEEARTAALRDRPHVYREYYATDLADSPPQIHERLSQIPFNCLVSVSALGFGDIPPKAFAAAVNLLSCPGWIAFNIKEDFLNSSDQTGFQHLLTKMIKEGVFTVHSRQRYNHRLSIKGQPLYYVSIVGKIQAHIPSQWL